MIFQVTRKYVQKYVQKHLQNFHIFFSENPRSLKYRLDTILCHAIQFWKQVHGEMHSDARETPSLAFFKNWIYEVI